MNDKSVFFHTLVFFTVDQLKLISKTFQSQHISVNGESSSKVDFIEQIIKKKILFNTSFPQEKSFPESRNAILKFIDFA